LLQLGLKFLPGLFDKGQRVKTGDPVPVAVVEVKDTAMDVFSLTNTRNAYSDTYGRRTRLAAPMISGRRA